MRKIINYILGSIFEGFVMSFIAVVGAFVYVKMHIDNFFKKFKKKKKK
jgi:hypothetical protein